MIRDLVKLYYQFEFLFNDKLKELEEENYYLFTLVYKSYNLHYKKHVKIKPEDLKKDPLLGLH
jgi:hypothetical protein